MDVKFHHKKNPVCDLCGTGIRRMVCDTQYELGHCNPCKRDVHIPLTPPYNFEPKSPHFGATVEEVGNVVNLTTWGACRKNSYSSPGTVKNYFSGSKVWITHHAGNTASDEANEIKEMLVAVSTLSRHVPCQAYPLTPQDLKIVCDYIHSHPQIPLAIKPCILIGFAGFLRASNLVSPSLNAWLGPHTILASDIVNSSTGLLVNLRSTKTIKAGKYTTLQIHKAPDIKYCPVFSWNDYKSKQNLCPIGPAFMVNHHVPLTSTPIVTVLKSALGHKLSYGQSLTMHSLRRGGTHTAARAGASNSSWLMGLGEVPPDWDFISQNRLQKSPQS